MRAWRVEGIVELFRHPLLRLERRALSAGGDRREVLVVDTPDWINVIPVDAAGRVVLVRQWRFGIAAPTLEIPGGMVDAGEDHATAAARELLEETGYRAATWRRLGALHPNPAIQSNRISTWLATDLVPPAGTGTGGLRGVEGEEIAVEIVPLAEIPRLIGDGTITHSLVVAAFYLLGLEAG
jgi:ADP-ribose diphosphatase